MTTRAPRVSIGVPVYNGEQYLATALFALVRQTFPDIEIIICDNASTDGTRLIAERFASSDPRVRYVRHDRNLGAAANFNSALELARGQYFRWAAADDVSGVTSVERCVEVLDRDPGVVLAYPRSELIDADGNRRETYDDRMHLPQHRPSDRFRVLLRTIRLCNPIFGLIRTADLRACRPLGGFCGSDIVLLSELSLRGRFHEVPEVLFSRRFHDGAASAMDPNLRMRHFDPAYQPRPSLRRWQLLGETLRNAGRAPIPVGERMRAAGVVVRNGLMNRSELASELTRASRHYLKRRSRAPHPS